MLHSLNKIASSPTAGLAEDEEGFFDCCSCGNLDDAAARGAKVKADNAAMPSKEDMADAFCKIVDAPVKPNDRLHFAVESLIPLQQITKWASNREYVNEGELKRFLADVEMVRGIRIILSFLSVHLNDAAAVVCSVRALNALMVDDVDGDWVNELSKERTLLQRSFLKNNGVETLKRAFGLHALTIPTDSRAKEMISQTELRCKTMEILVVALQHSEAASAADVLRFLCTVTPQMVDLLDKSNKPANKMLLKRTMMAIVMAIQVDGIKRELTITDAVDVLNVSVQVMKACPHSALITPSARVLWSWAANF